jgi:hypothetical protein
VVLLTAPTSPYRTLHMILHAFTGAGERRAFVRRTTRTLRLTSYNLRNLDTTSTTQKMNAVRFADDDEFIESDVIREDTSATWFTSSEMRRIRDRDAQLARRLSEANDEDALRAHGLESEYGRKLRKIRVTQGRLCVLLAQEELWENDKVEPELIARIYSEYTKKSAWAANKSGVICESQVRPFILFKEDLSSDTIVGGVMFNTTKIRQGSAGRPGSPVLSPAARSLQPIAQTNVSRSA